MYLTPTEEDRLTIFTAAQLARRSLADGARLNAPEATALICDEMHRAARCGESADGVLAAGRAALRREDLMDGIEALLPEIRLEVLLGDGMRLVVLREPVAAAMTGQCGRRSPPPARRGPQSGTGDRAGGWPGEAHDHRDQPLGSPHQGLLALPVLAGQSAARVRQGGRDRLPARYPGWHLGALGCGREPGGGIGEARWNGRWCAVTRMRQEAYSRQFGPTTGDRVRLGDTDLWLRVEDDHVGYGDEPVWGYARNIRSRMTQQDSATADSELDVLIAGVLLVDPLLGVVKTSIGIKDGRIAGIGRAGNPDVTSGVDLTIGPNTLPLMGYGLIATAGGVDSHVHLITPRLVPVALAGGVTTLITAGFEEPPAAMAATLRAFEHLPVNLGLQASARTEVRDAVQRVIEAGAIGLKIHEDWGAYPEIIDAVLGIADAYDVAVALHTDGLNESCELEDTVAAIGGRAVHAYHVEGAGGGHIPDLLGLVREPSVICSSTTPTIPYGTGTAAEHPEMILAVHGGSGDDPGDLELAAERVRPATLAAEGPLHELGAISIINSDSQGMGRIGETIRRTWQLADAMKAWRGEAGTAGRPGPSVPHGSGAGNGLRRQPCAGPGRGR